MRSASLDGWFPASRSRQALQGYYTLPLETGDGHQSHNGYDPDMLPISRARILRVQERNVDYARSSGEHQKGKLSVGAHINRAVVSFALYV
jgi:hypothetical protein